jgi:uncharacterized OB-fold protein
MPAADDAGAIGVTGAAEQASAGSATGQAGAAGAAEQASAGSDWHHAGGEVTAMRIGIIRRDDRSAAFFDAAARGQLLIRRCGTCGRWLVPEAGGCYQCGAEDPGWAPASGRGTLVSWAVLHPRHSPAAQASQPGVAGTSGTSGAGGASREAGTSGAGGASREAGTSGAGGSAGVSGVTGTSGEAAVSGEAGTSGEAAVSGVTGTSGEAAVTVLALVELDEGPWLPTVLAVSGQQAIGALRAGQRVAASFAHPDEGESYPVFRPVSPEDLDR